MFIPDIYKFVLHSYQLPKSMQISCILIKWFETEFTQKYHIPLQISANASPSKESFKTFT